mgnify:CR=1 FL=1
MSSLRQQLFRVKPVPKGDEESGSELKRTIGFFSLTMIGVGATGGESDLGKGQVCGHKVRLKVEGAAERFLGLPTGAILQQHRRPQEVRDRVGAFAPQQAFASRQRRGAISRAGEAPHVVGRDQRGLGPRRGRAAVRTATLTAFFRRATLAAASMKAS